MAKPQTKVGPPWTTVDQKSAGKAVQAGRVLHSKSRQNLKIRQKSGLDLTRLPGGGGLTTPAAIHRRPLETRDWGQIGRAALAN